MMSVYAYLGSENNVPQVRVGDEVGIVNKWNPFDSTKKLARAAILTVDEVYREGTVMAYGYEREGRVTVRGASYREVTPGAVIEEDALFKLREEGVTIIAQSFEEV